MSEVSSALSLLGLNENEIAIYRAALFNGTRPASILARKAGLKRGQTYNILETLKDKGIIQETIKDNVRHFCPLPPSSLVGLMDHHVDELVEKKRRLEEVLPVLESLRNPLSSQPKVKLYQGKNGIREIFEDILRSGKDMYSIVDLQYSWSTVDDDSRHWVEGFITRREKKKMCWHAIAVKSKVSDRELAWRSAANREVKMLSGVRIPAEVNIYGHKIALTSTNHEMVGAVIENQPIAETLLNLHRFLWSILPDYELD